MSCHAILKNLYEPRMDVILTIRFKITEEIETYVLCPTLQTRTLTRTCIGVLKSIIMFFHSFIAMEYAFRFFTVNSSINAAGERSSCRLKFHGKGIK